MKEGPDSGSILRTVGFGGKINRRGLGRDKARSREVSESSSESSGEGRGGGLGGSVCSVKKAKRMSRRVERKSWGGATRAEQIEGTVKIWTERKIKEFSGSRSVRR